MADTNKTYDGKFTLPQLNQTLVTQENLGFRRLTALQALPSTPAANQATFKDDPDPNPPPGLVLVQIAPGQDLSAVIADQQSKGRSLLFKSTVYVSGSQGAVAVFR